MNDFVMCRPLLGGTRSCQCFNKENLTWIRTGVDADMLDITCSKQVPTVP